MLKVDVTQPTAESWCNSTIFYYIHSDGLPTKWYTKALSVPRSYRINVTQSYISHLQYKTAVEKKNFLKQIQHEYNYNNASKLST